MGIRPMTVVRPASEPVHRDFAPVEYILVRNEHKFNKFNIKDILYIEGKGNYVSLCTRNSRIMALQSIKHLETLLLPYQFVRIQKSFIVSLQHIDTIEKNNVKIAGIEVPIGEHYKASFQTIMDRNALMI